MFELPNAKRVRRADLHRSRSTSPNDDSDDAESAPAKDTAALLARLNSVTQLSFDPVPPAPPATDSTNDPHPATNAPPDDDNDTFAFNLFSTKAPTHHQRQRSGHVRLDSPDANKPPGLRAQRPESYYHARPPTAQIAATALSGTAVLHIAARPTPGLRHAWRVTHLPLDKPSTTTSRGLTISLGDSLRAEIAAQPRSVDAQESGRARRARGRLGKKARLKRRVLARAEARARGAREAAEANERDKAARVAEKKRVLNRKKQHRKREKKREAGAGGDGGGDSA